MANPGDPALDPQAVLTSFDTAFRGYDTDAVDAHLRGIADALRRSTPGVDERADLAAAREELTSLEAARSAAEDRAADLETRVRELEAAVAAAADRPVPPAPEFDEALAMRLLGEETTKVLEQARRSASTIVADAEAEAARRTAEVDAHQAKVSSELDEARRTADDELTARRESEERSLAQARSEVEAEIERVRAEATEAAEAERAAAHEEAEQERAEAARVRAEADEAAEAARVEASTAADALRAEADTDAARLRAEAEADVLAARESAKETARAMVVEAQRMREKVLGDLVARRRDGRADLDQAVAARDRLQRLLRDVRADVDESIEALGALSPEVRSAQGSIGAEPEPVDEAGELDALEAELGARLTGGPGPTVVSSGSAAISRTSGADAPAPTERVAADDREASAPVGEADVDGSEAGPGAIEASDDAETSDDADGADAAEVDDADPTPEPVGAPSSDSADETTRPVEATVIERTPTAAADVDVDPDEGDDDDDGPEVPASFQARDVAVTRHGAELRRRLKRLLADEQSAILDGLTHSRSVDASELLPDADGQRAKLIELIRPPLEGAAAAGGEFVGDTSATADLDPLFERIVAAVWEPTRARVLDTLADTSDPEEAFDPVRAHYREVRLSVLPELTDDALAEAFAAGVEAGIADGTSVVWVADPRFEPSSDCHDDTLAGAVVKPEPFPTGRHRPGDQPGCRCLVVPVDLVDAD